jgi:endonuclease/exonuclease/phosphatase (EEP) superfamily protein YafD
MVVVVWFLLLLMMDTIGTRLYTLAPLYYLPKVWLAAPFLLLALPGYWWERRWTWWLGLLAFFHAIVLLEWRSPRPSLHSGDGSRLRVVSCNRGDQDEASWVKWLAAVKPDLVAMQDVGACHHLAGQSPDAAGLPNFLRIGEHAIASRYPIRRMVPISPAASITNGSLGYLPCMRVEIDMGGKLVVVYSIHVRSPRTHFKSYRSWKIWSSPMRSEVLSRYWVEQEKLLKMLLISIRAETDPVIVVGDLNVPDMGPLYREVTKTLQDAHRVAGVGYGYTFPGDVKALWAGWQPWLRIDYILPGGGWKVQGCEVQDSSSAGESQHRAVLADLLLR